MADLYQDRLLALKDQDLRARHIDLLLLRRWFNQQHGLTFDAYERMLRIDSAFADIRKGSR